MEGAGRRAGVRQRARGHRDRLRCDGGGAGRRPAAPAPPRGPAAAGHRARRPAAAVGPAARPAPGAGKINLDKGRVSLQKNQTVSLVKGGRPLLSQVKMGLGWEPAFRGKDIDLDASVIAC